jgi:cytochrome c oxidase assembly factor CtaG
MLEFWLKGVAGGAFAIIALCACAYLTVYLPGLVLERHTNQPGTRYIWWVVGSLLMVFSLIAMFSYGYIWDIARRNLYGDAGAREAANHP